jgi:molybdenum cofactor biosynthesis enzyme MoaA
MKCSYCSSKYYGGRESSYDTGVIISELTNTDLLEDDVHVVWGGGEPTLSSKFKQVTKDLIDNEKIHKIRVLSNSLKFSEDLYKFVSSEKIRIVTSIDAGTQDTFQKVRGKGNLIQVLENLKKYSEKISSHENLTIKYIITNDNQNSFEIKSFVDLVKKYGFERNFIQISCNFSYEKLTKETIFSVYELAARLMNQGFEFVYFDDLIRDRLILNEDVADEIIDYLKQNDIFNENILSYKSKKVVILWGDGYQSKWIKNNTTFGKYDKVLKIVTNNNELGSDISNENVILCPSAVQQLPDVYKDIKKINILDGKLKFVIFI